MRRLFPMLLLAAVLGILMPGARAQSTSGESVRSALSRHVGQTVTLKLDSGEELTGTLRTVGDGAVVLEKLSGRDFYDAVVDVEEIAALIYKAR